MTHRNRPTTTLLACLATTTLLTACTNPSPEAGHPNTSPRPAESVSSSSQPTTASPTPTLPSGVPTEVPARPAAATGLELGAAESFLGHYVALLNYAYATGDTAPMLAASDKGCVGCSGTAQYLKVTNGRNGGLTGDYADHLAAVTDLFRGTGGKVGGTVSIRSGNYVERVGPTAAPTQKKAHTESWTFTLAPASGNWVMYELQVAE